MTEQEQVAALNDLKQLVEESDQAFLNPPCELACPGCSGGEPISTRTMTDEQLLAQLRLYNWNIKRTTYAVLIYKSKASGITLSSGLKLPDQSGYFRRLASMYRTPGGGMLQRVDEPIRGDD